ncbi:HNH endonuclease [Paenibacillus ehimensis]|uniref:HNH endonuclease n=1 Tax=Paenibacillus ehimensis TaxID=79264 RepID=UPI002DBCE632|nr:HNH endonuclease [Paenibacillus ehimensis]MEC0207665.1 HNH endonuclease [Paenibacillus ehimensis]
MNIQRLNQLAEQGSVDAQYLLGIMLINESDSIQQGLPWLEMAATAGHTLANFMLGCYYYQLGTTVDLKHAHTWLNRASKRGHPQAHYLLGVAYYYGHGCTKNIKLANRLLNQSIESGNLSNDQIIIAMLLVQQITSNNLDPEYESFVLSNVIDLQEAHRNKRVRNIIQRNSNLVSELKLLYKNKCQVCGKQLDIGGGESYSEVHHIRPLGEPHNGPDIIENMIVLCPDHHLMFDRGALSIDLKNKRVLHTNTANIIHGHSIQLIHTINQEYIDYHNNFIFI